MQTYTKIDTLYKRFMKLGVTLPADKERWRVFQNNIIPGLFSNPVFKLFVSNGILLECYSKVDGTNSKIAFFPSDGSVKVGGKTDDAVSQKGQFEWLDEFAKERANELKELFGSLAPRYKYADNREALTPTSATPSVEERPVLIYGEWFGAGIQKGGGRYCKEGRRFIVFDICQQGWWLPRDKRDEVCAKLGLETVPYLGERTLHQVESVVIGGFATKVPNVSDPTLLEEGIVCRPVIPFCDERGNRVIVKVKTCDYEKWKSMLAPSAHFDWADYEEFLVWYSVNVEKIDVAVVINATKRFEKTLSNETNAW